MRASFIAGIVLSAAAGLALPPPPAFRAADVRPHGAAAPHPLLPGMLAWIFGTNLSSRSCGVENLMNPATYKAELCGTRVLIGGIDARLIFVSEGQINLRVPEHPWENRMVDVQVIRDGVASANVPVRFGANRAVVTPPGAAYAGMPVWVRVERPWRAGSLRYPFHLEPWDLGPACFEVRLGSEAIKPLSVLPFTPGCLGGNWMIGLPGEVPERYLHRLPLHTVYPLDRPGTYQIRYAEYRPQPGSAALVPHLQSEWTPLEIRASAPEQRRAWLGSLGSRAPQDAVELLSDYLPSLLAARDESALKLLAPYLDHPDTAVRGYAAYALNYFDPELLARIVPGRKPTRGGVR